MIRLTSLFSTRSSSPPEDRCCLSTTMRQTRWMLVLDFAPCVSTSQSWNPRGIYFWPQIFLRLFEGSAFSRTSSQPHKASSHHPFYVTAQRPWSSPISPKRSPK